MNCKLVLKEEENHLEIKYTAAGRLLGHVNSENHLSPVGKACFQAVNRTESITINDLSV